MSKIKILFLNFGAIAFACLFLFYSPNPPDGKTGGPGEGTCGDCHSGGSFGGNIEIIGLPSTINANQSYNITVKATNTSGNANEAGFQLMALNSNNMNAGDLIALSADHGTNTTGGREYVEHRSGKPFDGNNEVEWTFKWIAPAGTNGTNITFYCDLNMVDGNGGTGGDKFFLATASGTLVVNTTPVEVTVTSTDVSCNGGNNGTATANPSGGTSPYTYKWSNTKTTQTITGLTVGTYKVTVTDKDGQTATGEAAITQPTPINVSLNNGVLTCVQSEIMLKTTVGGGVTPYNYLWSTNETGSEIIIDNPGVYGVTITDDNGCTKTATTTITQNITEPVISIDPPGLISCAEPVIQLNATVNPMNSLLLWTTSDGKIIGGPNSLNPLVSKPGLYTLSATNPINGCNSVEIVQVNGVVPMTTSISLTNVNCNGDSTGIINASPAGGLPPYEYFWSSGEKTKSIDSLPAGVYTVTINDKSTCHDTVTVEVIQPSKLVAFVTSTDQTAPNKNDGTATVNPSGGSAPYDLLWSTGDTTNMVNQLGVGTFTVDVTDSLGCKVTESVFINPFNCGLSIGGEIIEILCHDGTTGKICATPVGGTSPYTYNWSNNSDLSCIENLSAGTYNLTVTDAIGCIHLEQFTLNQPEMLNLPLDSISVVGESGFGFSDGSALLNATGGIPPYMYLFDNGGMDGKNLNSGLNSVVITDANGCNDVFQFVVPAYPCDSLGVEAINLNIKNCVGQLATVDILSVAGGVGPFTYKWDNGTDKMSVTDLYSEINSITITDSKNCASKFFTNISAPDTIKLDFDVVDATPGSMDGSIFVTTMGGQAPYTYLWNSEGKSGQFIENLPPGTYCVTVTDFYGCTSIDCVEVKNKVGTSDLIADGWKLFPNPASEYIYLQKSILDSAPLEWEIFNANGEQVVKGKLESVGGIIPVYLGSQSSGTYILLLKHNDKTLISRFIIQ